MEDVAGAREYVYAVCSSTSLVIPTGAAPAFSSDSSCSQTSPRTRGGLREFRPLWKNFRTPSREVERCISDWPAL